MVRNSTQPDHRPSQVIPTLSTVRHGQQSHSFTTPQPHSYITQRSSSPMAHLPYPEDIQRRKSVISCTFSASTLSYLIELVSPYGHPSDNDPRWTEYRPEARTYVHHPQPHYPIPPTPAETQYHQRYTPGSIALPAPTRSPPLIEDTPKKPLSLACLFCRKRKIACGSPPPDREDRTCK